MSHFTVPELKSYLEAHHLSQEGKKPELVKRYQRHVSLLKMSLNELRTECEDAHISRTGTKAEIIIRLMGDDAIPITRHSERPASPRVVPRIEQIYAEEAAKERSRSPARRSRSRSPAPRARSKSPARSRDRSKSPAARSPKPKAKVDDERNDKPVALKPVTFVKATELGPLIVSPFVNIASATDGQPCISVYDPIIRTRKTKDGDCTSYDKNADSGEGRVVIDCGFTKLYCNWDDAGTARYVVNATCWLYAMERLRAAEAPAEAKAPEPAELTGNYHGGQQMTFDIDFNDDCRVRENNMTTLSKRGALGSHLIFTGVSRLFEGITICHPALISTKRIPAHHTSKQV